MTAEMSAGTLSTESAPVSIPAPRTALMPRPMVRAGSLVGSRATSLTRRRSVWPGVTIDALLAVGVGGAAAALGASPGLALATTVLWPVLLVTAGHYRHRALGEDRSPRLTRVAMTGVRALVLVLAATPWLSDADPRSLVALVSCMTAASGLHAIFGVRRRRHRIVLAGRPRDVREALAELGTSTTHEVVAACLTRAPKSTMDVPAYVGLESSSGVAHEHQADAVVVLPGARMTSSALRRLHWALAAMGSELCVGTGLLDVAPDRTRMLSTAGLHLVHVAPAPLRGARRTVKDVVERCGAALALALLLPALAVVGVVIRVDSRGPALYRQTRVGRDGRHFTMVKFRSMSTDADRERSQLLDHNEADGVLFKMHSDPRVTRVGAWLRRWSIDEVPQLWNVLRGDMALVGPRPALPEEVARYDVDPTRRLVVKPGLTGLWQVSGRSDLSWAESVRLDVRYVDNWSLRLDLHILLRTAKAVLGHHGAY